MMDARPHGVLASETGAQTPRIPADSPARKLEPSPGPFKQVSGAIRQEAIRGGTGGVGVDSHCSPCPHRGFGSSPSSPVGRWGRSRRVPAPAPPHRCPSSSRHAPGSQCLFLGWCQGPLASGSPALEASAWSQFHVLPAVGVRLPWAASLPGLGLGAELSGRPPAPSGTDRRAEGPALGSWPRCAGACVHQHRSCVLWARSRGGAGPAGAQGPEGAVDHRPTPAPRQPPGGSVVSGSSL